MTKIKAKTPEDDVPLPDPENEPMPPENGDEEVKTSSSTVLGGGNVIIKGE